MMFRTALIGALATLATLGAAGAQDCPNPDALGTARTVAVDPAAFARIGFMQYKANIELQPKEVILTFDDGPLPPLSTLVYDTLKRECVKATFFIVGRMARAYPAALRRVAADGHTIAAHSQTHPIIFPKLTFERGKKEIDDGFATINAVLAEDGRQAAPWFRFPGLGRTNAFEAYLASQKIAVMSADFTVDDWLHLKADEVYNRALSRLEAAGKGMMLLHDIQPSTATMLPRLLRTLKERGYKIVHMVPAGTPGVPLAAVETRGAPRPARAADPAALATPTAAPATTPAGAIPIPRTMDRPPAIPATLPTAPAPTTTPPAAKPPAGEPQRTGSIPAPVVIGRDHGPAAAAEMPFTVFFPSTIPQDLRGRVQ